MQKLLLLEDDSSLVDGLIYSLEKNGFEVEVSGTIKEAEKMLAVSRDFSLLLFDVTLPDGNGISLCEKIRAAGNQTPIIFLTASDEETNVIRGLDCGGDDYITKPFRLGELCSRIRALLRRSAGRHMENDVLCSGDIMVNLTEGRALLRGENVELTAAEYRYVLWDFQGCFRQQDFGVRLLSVNGRLPLIYWEKKFHRSCLLLRGTRQR